MQATQILDADPPEDPRFRVMRLLVNALLMVLIAGVLTIVISILLALKRPSAPPPAADVPGLADGETLIRAEATESRITLVLEGADGGRRVIILDAATLRPITSLSAP